MLIIFAVSAGLYVPISYARNDVGLDAAIEVTRKAMTRELPR